MINDQTILSSFDDKPTLLEWLKKVEDALKSDTATAVSVENPSANTYVFKITFADGKTLSSGNVVFPDSVKDVSIKNNHIIVTSVGGTQTDLGVLNPYADTIVVNAETNTTEIGGKLQVSGEAQVTGNVTMGGNLGVTGQAVVGGGLSVNSALGVTGNATIGGRLQADSSIISNGEIRGGNISGTKFLLGTEEMPLVKANPAGEATETLAKVKIGNVAYKVGGSAGGANYYPISDFLDLQSGSVINGAYNTMLNLIQQGKFLGLTWNAQNIVLHYVGDYFGIEGKTGILLCYITAHDGPNDYCRFYAFLNDDTFVNKEAYFVPEYENLPNYSSTKTYVLKLVNGVINWIEG